MRTRPAVLVALGLLVAATPAWPAENAQFDWKPWSRLAIQDSGRSKPLDTFSGETFRILANRTSFQDPETGQRLDRNQLYMVLLFQWQGWDHSLDQVSASGPRGHVQYFDDHPPDKWDLAPLLHIDDARLRSAFGMAKGEEYISPVTLSRATVVVPDTHREQPFLVWAESLLRKEQEELTKDEAQALTIANRFWAYQDHRMGNRFRILPAPDNEDQKWMSIAELLRTPSNAASGAPDPLQEVRQQFRNARTAYLTNSPAAMHAATLRFLAAVRQAGMQQGTYPAQATLDLEVSYNHWAPFRCAWILMALAFLCLTLGRRTDRQSLLIGGWVTFALGLLAAIIGFAIRFRISGRAPVTNMYESVLYVSLGVAVLGAILEFAHRKRYVLTASAAVAAVGWMLADNFPAVLDPSLRPLQPILHSNFWLLLHVMTITLSYAAFALAMGIGNISLVYFLSSSTHRDTINCLTAFTCRAMQVGVLLLAIGTLLGAVWADYSWGRFWSWDPKEVWALIALLGYLGVLHAHLAGWVRPFGLAVLAVISFSLIVMAWYGVNFVLSVGLHSYGFGAGGVGYVLAALALQGLYVAVAATRYALREQDEANNDLVTSLPANA